MPWLRGGTVAVTNGSTTVIGTNADFAANAKNGDAFVGPDGATYEIGNVASATVLSIIPAYKGPTVGGASYAIMPVQGYPKALADAFNDINRQWGVKLTALGTTGNYDILPVTKGGTGGATAADARSGLGLGAVSTENILPVSKGGTGGSDQAAARTGLGLGGAATENIVPVSKGGTGGSTQATARTGLGLGSAAVANVGTAAGNVMAVGAGGWLGPSIIDNGNANNAKTTGLYGLSNAVNAPFVAVQLFTSDWGVDSRWQSQLALGISQNKAYFRSIVKDQTSATAWAEFYHTGNTTKGSGGVLSAASPIVRVSNVAGSLRLDLLEQTFEPAGEWGVANEEARGVVVERLAVGQYRITGSLGLALEGWRTLDPCSPDGGRTLGITESQQEPDGTVVIKLFKQRWTLSEDGEMIEGRGAALDVPLNSWIDVRLEMPKPEELPLSTDATIEE